MLSLLIKILEVEFKAIAELDQRIIRWEYINRVRRLTVKLVSDSNLDLDLVDLVTLCCKFMEEFNADGCYLGLIELLQKMAFPPNLIEQVVNHLDRYAQMKLEDERTEEDLTIGHYILDANQLELISIATILEEMPIVVYELLYIILASVESKMLTSAGQQEFKVRQTILNTLLDRLSEETGFKYSRVYYRAPVYPKYTLVNKTLTSYFEPDQWILRDNYRALLDSLRLKNVDFSLEEGRLRITFGQDYTRDTIKPIWDQLFIDPRRKYFD